MKALALIQPWASLVVLGEKRIETRSWSTRFTGTVAIHASKGLPDEARFLCGVEPFRSVLAKHGLGADILPRACIIGTAKVIGCVGTDQIDDGLSDKERAFGDYRHGRYGFLLSDPRPLATSIPARGCLGLWDLPDEVRRAIEAQLETKP